MDAIKPFWERPLDELDRGEWEALCDGCGKCCLHKVEEEVSGDIYMTNIACRLLDIHTAQCSNYRLRRAHVPDCVRLTPEKLATINWLPDSCSYVLRSKGEALPDWHYLLCGDREAIHKAGKSVAGRVVEEDKAGPIEHHILPDGI